MDWTLNAMRSKIRKLTGRPDSNQISNATLLNFINDYYRNKMPTELGLPPIFGWFDIWTTAYKGEYSIDDESDGADIKVIKPPVTVDGKAIPFTLDPNWFFANYPQSDELVTDETLYKYTGSGNVSFTNGSTNSIVATSALLSSTTGFRAGDVITISGTTNNNASVTIATISESGGDTTITTIEDVTTEANTSAVIYVWKRPSQAEPQMILVLDRTIWMRPVPDADNYYVKMPVEKYPTALAESGASSVNIVQNEWGPTICYGASIDICMEDGETEEAAILKVGYDKEKAIVTGHHLRELLKADSTGSPKW